MSDEDTFVVTETGNSVYYAFIEAYRKKYPELSEEQARQAIREGKE
jgi:hypothetical protein